jgi:hypothetical protein
MWNYICIDANPSFGLVIEAKKKKKKRQKELALHVKA